jgi:AcrR family transcriptional regulator
VSTSKKKTSPRRAASNKARNRIEDHRTRTGRERSRRMRERIIAAAITVFARRGPDAPVIDDFITAAGIARGTFYSHFKSTEELLVATSNATEDTVMEMVLPRVMQESAPDRRIAVGVRLWLQRAQVDPVLCAFVVRNRIRAPAVERELARDIGDGIRRGLLRVASIKAGRDLLVGTVRETMARLVDEPVSAADADDVVRSMLRESTPRPRRIERLLAIPLELREPSSPR